MSGRVTMWGAGEILKSYFSRDKVPPEIFYVALIKDIAPNPFISGAELDEPDVVGYQRAEIPNDLGYWSSDIQPQIVVMDQEIMFTTATEDWGRMRYWALCDAPSDGNNYFIGAIDDVLIVKNGDTPSIGTGNLSISLGPFFITGEG